ncbi:MAG: RluA family pseudouridine synthase [Candidatus Aureabacteria bacterium]|nr:RluA family pseudouridine synthase [Candidatus Auribacterota bacterium]
MKTFKLIVDAENSGTRVDKFLSLNVENFSRSFLKKLVDEQKVRIKGLVCKPGEKLSEGDVVEVEIPDVKPLDVLPENIPLNIIFEDEDIVVVNKPAGLVVHPSAGNYEHTLVNALLYHIKDLSGINGILRPGIVHRLDKNTSGVMVVAKNDRAHKYLSEQFKDKKLLKEYYALVFGRVVRASFEVILPIGRCPRDRKKMAVVASGKEARTAFNLLKRWEGYSLVSAVIHTGRTHQIRVHLSNEGFPIVGDSVYARSRRHKIGDIEIKRQMLHSKKLELYLPSTQKIVKFEAPVPEDMAEAIDYLDGRVS